jgi:hypothetical protein
VAPKTSGDARPQRPSGGRKRTANSAEARPLSIQPRRSAHLAGSGLCALVLLLATAMDRGFHHRAAVVLHLGALEAWSWPQWSAASLLADAADDAPRRSVAIVPSTRPSTAAVRATCWLLSYGLLIGPALRVAFVALWLCEGAVSDAARQRAVLLFPMMVPMPARSRITP